MKAILSACETHCPEESEEGFKNMKWQCNLGCWAFSLLRHFNWSIQVR